MEENRLPIEHLGYRVKSDDNTFEFKIKPEIDIKDEEARDLIENFFKTFSIKVNVLTLTDVRSKELDLKDNRTTSNLPSPEKRKYVMAYCMPKKFSIYDYLDYFRGQDIDMIALKKTYNVTVQSLLDEGRIKPSKERRGRAMVYEIIKSEETEELMVKHGETYIPK